MRREEEENTNQITLKAPITQITASGMVFTIQGAWIDYNGLRVTEVPAGEKFQVKVHYSCSWPDKPWYLPGWVIGLTAVGPFDVALYDNTIIWGNLGTGIMTLDNPEPAIMPDANLVIDIQPWGSSTESDWYIKPSTLSGNWQKIGKPAYLAVRSKLPKVELEILEVDIVGGKGYVKTDPTSREGRSTWYAGDTGTFPYGTWVKVTAYPDSGYKFDHWSDEIQGGTSTNNPEYVKVMTEHRAIKCHFREIDKTPPELPPGEPEGPEGPEPEYPPVPGQPAGMILPMAIIGVGLVTVAIATRKTKKP